MVGLGTLALLINLGVIRVGIEDGWKGIKPLETRKADVERIVGRSTSELNGYYLYKTPDAVLDVNYSTKPCTPDAAKRGDYSVPEDTVLDYVVTIKGPLKLSGLEFKREKYDRDDGAGHLINYAVYIDKEDGITVEVFVENGDEYVRRILVRPSPGSSEQLKCKSLKGN